MRATVTRRELLAVTAAISGAGIFTACGVVPVAAPAAQAPKVAEQPVAAAPKSTGPVTISYWAWQGFVTQGQIGYELLEVFHKENTDVKIEVTPLAVGLGQKEKLLTAAAAGAPPDLFYMDRYLAGQLSAPGVLAVLDDKIKATKAFQWEDFWPKLRQDVTWKGKIYAVPLHTDARTFVWNKDHFLEVGLDPEKPPASWDDLQTAIKKLAKAGSGGRLERVAYTPTFGNPPAFLQWYIHFWQLGGEYLTPDNKKPNFNNKAGVDALKFMVGLLDLQGGLEKINEVLGQSVPTGSDNFTVGRVSMMTAGNWYNAVYTKQWKAPVKFGMGPLPLPPQGHKTNYQGGWTLASPQGAKNKDIAFRFIEFMLRKDIQPRWAINAGNYIPALQSVANSPEFLKEVPEAKVFLEELKTAKWVPVIPGNDEIINADAAAWTNASTKKMTPEEAIAQKEKDVQNILTKWAEFLESFTSPPRTVQWTVPVSHQGKGDWASLASMGKGCSGDGQYEGVSANPG